MRIEGHPFELQIIGEDGNPVQETAQGHIGLCHGECYSLRLTNEGNVRVAVQLTIDGTPLENRFVVGGYRFSDLETIPNTGKKLTFFESGTNEAQQAFLDGVSEQNLGVISATFSREKPKQVVLGLFNTRGLSEGASRSASAGGTGLSGYSNQRFSPTSFNDDTMFEPVTLNIRLYCDPNRKSSLDAHPIPGRVRSSNPVPPPVGENGCHIK